uniref:Ig-like domain-containing protein n=1 Tax=Capra hircus TaxID=9925 RepID=A0A452E0V1_CAPHI
MYVLASPGGSDGKESAGSAGDLGKSECHFSNGTQQVRFLDRYIYNREELVRFDSLVGEYRARTEMGRPAAERWNRWPDAPQRARAAGHDFCASNYEFFASRTVQRRVEPTVTVYPVKSRPLWHHNLLVCSVNGFYPGHIEVKWFQNGQEEEAGVVSTGLIPNGDWTFQIMVMLEIVPQGGEVYTCHVEHPSRMSPVTAEWRAQDESSKEKMLSGIGACVLGLLFLGMGLLFYIRSPADCLEEEIWLYSMKFSEYNLCLVDLNFPRNPESTYG